MNSAKKPFEYIDDYRCKVIEHLKSVAPDDFIVTMRCSQWPQFRLLVERLFDPDTPVHNNLKKYDVEWVNTTIPCCFHTDPIRNTVIGNQLSVIGSSKTENCSDKQIVQNVSLKFVGWEGLICVSIDEDKMYACNIRLYSAGRPTGFLFAAYKNRDFVERLIADYWKAENL